MNNVDLGKGKGGQGAKPRLLWLGDAVVPTGFAKVTHSVLHQLKEKWDIAVLGINYNGDPHPFPYKIYPALRAQDIGRGGDQLGLSRLFEILNQWKPDIIVAIQDPWNMAAIVQALKETPGTFPPIVTYMPVDGENMSRDIASELAKADLSIFYTRFGAKQAMQAGYRGGFRVIPHGVDITHYSPRDRAEARRILGIAEVKPIDCFLFGNVNRNQPRKRLDLSIAYFSKWLYSQDPIPENVHLYLHCSQLDEGWNIGQLASYYGLKGRVVVPANDAVAAITERLMPAVYNAIDVQISTTEGEGWGLTQHEGMACGIPQIVPRSAAQAEWCDGAVQFVGCSSYGATANRVNTIRRVPDEAEFIAAFDQMYKSAEVRKKYSDLGLARARDPKFQWSVIGQQFHEALLYVLGWDEKAAAV